MTLAPYSAILFSSFGGPNGPDDVLPFMRNATRGRGVPDERLMEVSEHYMLFGGKSPINELNLALIDRIRAELDRRGIDVPVVFGNRNWEPYFADTVDQLIADGHHKVLALATSAYQSYSSCAQYCQDLEGAASGKDIRIDKIDPYWDAPEFSRANANSLIAAVRALRERVGGDAKVRVLFVTHSIPTAMNDHSSTGEPENRYDAQHLKVARAVADLAGEELGELLTWELTYCSRSGSPHVPWLEPDINDRMEEIKDEVDAVVAAPIGFISDHMEVLYDLDTEAAQTAKELGLPYERAATVDTDPVFVSLLVDRLVEWAEAERGERERNSICKYATGNCCLVRNPNQTNTGAHHAAPRP
ncbi:ferrochelatase [Tessaracoccus oleiagri]|uniref:Coproporphyrin III ferrochelatase n=1 Tax=Tessaracoccus oleiagri TaxID=686624 RepID=A0A1G9H5W2_9ACTN|nr:ferrochelatase [Tessaracoccus oleiagri]SDL08366.1 ferrochelatase [Tessaracoccus oleiagri]